MFAAEITGNMCCIFSFNMLLEEKFLRKVEHIVSQSRRKKVRRTFGWFSKEQMKTELKFSPCLGPASNLASCNDVLLQPLLWSKAKDQSCYGLLSQEEGDACEVSSLNYVK